jgi:hypothetical protein
VFIDPEAEPLTEIPLTQRVRGSLLAQLQLSSGLVNARRPVASRDDSGGLADYSGRFNPDLMLEDFCHAQLVAIAEEFCLQGHLLVRAFMMAIAERWGDDVARTIATQQWIGIAGLAAERVAAALTIRGRESPDERIPTLPADLDAIAKLFQVHPAFYPRAYVDLRVERSGDEVRCAIGDCPAFAEGDTYSWFALLGPEPHRALDAMVRTINPRARCRPWSSPDAHVSWRVTIDPHAEPAPEPPEVRLTKVSKGATFRFTPRH